MDMRSHGCCFVGAGFGMIKVWNACVPYLFFPGALSMNPFTESTVARPLASPGVAETAPAQKKSRPRFVKNLRRFVKKPLRFVPRVLGTLCLAAGMGLATSLLMPGNALEIGRAHV